MRKDVDQVNLGRDHGKTPDRGHESGHTPENSGDQHRKPGDLPKDQSGNAAIEKARPKETDRGGA